MKTLVNDTETKPGLTLDSFLSDYKAPMSVNPQPLTGQPTPTVAPINSPGSNALNNTIQYYRTGKKAGQPRPQKNTFLPPPTTTPGAPSNTGAPVIQNELISGALFITLIDLVFPVVIAFVNNRFSKQKVDSDKLRMDEKQRKDLEPLCDQVVRQLNINANPALLLVVSLGGIYAMNTMMQRSLNPVKK